MPDFREFVIPQRMRNLFPVVVGSVPGSALGCREAHDEDGCSVFCHAGRQDSRLEALTSIWTWNVWVEDLVRRWRAIGLILPARAAGQMSL